MPATGLEWLDDKQCPTGACLDQLLYEKLCELTGDGGTLPGGAGAFPSGGSTVLICRKDEDGVPVPGLLCKKVVENDELEESIVFDWFGTDGSTETGLTELTGFCPCDSENKSIVGPIGEHKIWCTHVFACVTGNDIENATFFACNPETGVLEMADKTKIGQNPQNVINCFEETCPFEVLSDGTPITLATLQAAAAGLAVPGTDDGAGSPVVFDPAIHTLHGYELVLASQGDEVGAEGLVGTTCDALWTKGGKERNLEPGGAADDDKPKGVDVADFTLTPVAGSVIVGTICVSVCVNTKTGEIVDKSAK